MPSSRAFQRRQARVKRTPRCWDRCACPLLAQRNAVCSPPHPHECVYAHVHSHSTAEDFCFPPSYNLMGFFLPFRCVPSLNRVICSSACRKTMGLFGFQSAFTPERVRLRLPSLFWDGIVLCIRRVQVTWRSRVIPTLLSCLARVSLYSWFKTRCVPGDPPTCTLRSYDDPISSRCVLFYRTYCKPKFFSAIIGLWCDVVW